MSRTTVTVASELRACPRCGLAQDRPAEECPGCGVVFAKLDRQRQSHPVLPADGAETTADDSPAVRFGVEYDVSRIEPEGRRALVIGAALAAVVLALPFLRFVFTYMTILVHELGHAAFGWLFGYPSLPAFDFQYGGGVTSHQGRQTGLLVVLYLGWAGALVAYRRHLPGLIAVGALLTLYTVAGFTALHEHLMVSMGHGTELLFAGIFFYRALSGYAVQVAVERPLYAFLAFFMVALDLHFAFGLARSEVARELYGEAKGGGHWMDFSVLAHDLGVELAQVALLFGIAGVLVLPAAWLIFRYRYTLGAAFHRAFLAPWF